MTRKRTFQADAACADNTVVVGLDYNSAPVEQRKILGTSLVQISSENATPFTHSSNPIEFRIPRGSTMIDMDRCFIELEVQFLTKDLQEIDVKKDKSFLTPCNCLPYMMFKSCVTYINSQPICVPSQDYGLGCYSRLLLMSDSNARDLCGPGLFKCSVLNDNVIDPFKVAKFKGDDGKEVVVELHNEFQRERYQKFFASERVKMYFKLMCDFDTSQMQLIPPDNEVVIKLIPADISVFATALNNALPSDYALRVHSANLFVNRVTVTNSAVPPASVDLSMKKYTTFTRSIPAGTSNSDFNLSLDGVSPRRVTFALFTSTQYNGSLAVNSLHAAPHNLQEFNVQVGQISYPVSMTFCKTGAECRWTTAKFFNLFNLQQHDLPFDANKMEDGHMFYVVDTSLSNRAHCNIKDITTGGTTSLQLRFTKPTTETLVCFALCEFDSVLTLHQDKSISLALQ